MKLKVILIAIFSLFLLGVGACPTEPEKKEPKTIEEPPAFPEVPPVDG